jgi:hypothetical protein
MKSNSVKNKKEIDNKKPPIKEETKSEKKEEPEKKEITEEMEKKMYEGQEHIEETQVEQKNIEEEKPKEIPKKEMLIKPRETYLQEKISKMNCNKNLMSNIRKELGDKVKTVIKEDNVLITEVPKDLNKFMQKVDSKSGKNIFQNYFNKQKYKEVKKLNDELSILRKNYAQLDENEKLLQDEGFIQLNNSQKESTLFDKSIKVQQLKLIQDKKEKMGEKIKSLEYEIKNIMENQKLLTNKEKVKEFLDNFERDKEIVEIRAKKYLKESKERDQRMQNDINQLIEKRKKEIEEKDKEEKNIKEEKLRKFKEQEKAIEQKQSKLSEEIFIKYKPYINQKPEKTKKNYLYNQRYENFLKKEEKLFKDKFNKNKKEKDKITYKFEDIDKFAVEYDEKLENRKYEQEQKSMELSEQWAKNRGKLPKSNYVPENEKLDKSLDEEKIRIEDTRSYQYGKNIRENMIPEIDIKKKREREAIIFSLEDPKNANKKYTLNKQKKNRIILKKRDNSKPSKYKWKLKLEENEADKKEEAINQNLIRKPKKINLQPITRTSTQIPEKKPDYLQEIINKKEEKKRVMSSKERENSNYEIDDINKKSKKWEKEINNKGGSLIENINNVQEKAKIIDQEADLKEKLLHVNGGIENNPELGRKVSNLLIDSIQAKINILKKMNQV